MSSSRAFAKFDLTGRTAVVTGGGTGVGYYMARGLARSGARVLIGARRAEVLEKAAARLRDEAGGEVSSATVDLADRESIRSFADGAISRLGGVDIFVGNAGQEFFQPIDALTDETLEQAMQVNLLSNLQLTRAFLPGMRKKRWGRILFSSSATSIAGAAAPGMTTYTATKGALNSAVHTIAAECGHDGITCNTILLGIYLTDILGNYFEMIRQSQGESARAATIAAMSSGSACGRLGRADEVEGLIQFLASDAAAYITGSNLCADGGMTTLLQPNPAPAEPVFPREF